MNIAIVLSGGTGTRMKLSMPKQYVEVGGKPIIGYCLDTFQNAKSVDRIVIVCHSDYRSFIEQYVATNVISKVCAYAESGVSRQGSILNGLLACESFASAEDVVILHDAARPRVKEQMIDELTHLDGFDGMMPVLPVKDTVYYTDDGKTIGKLLNRDKIFAGQAPESFVFGKYIAINKAVSTEEINATRGSSEIAFKHGLSVKLVEGDEDNYKITTIADLEKFEDYIAEKNR